MNTTRNDGLFTMFNISRAAGAAAFLFASAVLANAQQQVQPLMGAPLPGLTPAELARFDAGKEAFGHVQSIAEGLGPIMNDTSCEHCHQGPASGGSADHFVVRFGIAAHGAVPFDPMGYHGGSLLQALSNNSPTCDDVLPPQADVMIHRITPPCFGFGLIEAIIDADIQVREAIPPPGVSGKANMVVPAETPLGPPRVGRFGWKAQVPTVLTFSGDASVNELGLSNRLFPIDNQPNGPPTLGGSCDTVADPEDGPDTQGFHKIDRMTDFQRFLAPPPQTPKSGMSGAVIFDNIGCNKCHVSTPYTTSPAVAEAALQNKPFKPYSDFLVHDVGPVLGDGIPMGMATENEFRTTPLWGVQFRARANFLLHDARANNAGPEGNLDLAILAHGGEATAVTNNYIALSAGDKLALHKFLLSLGQAEFNIDSPDQLHIGENDWFFLRPLLTGPGSFFTPDSPSAVADFDQDGDFDLRDIAGFQRAFTGGV